MGETDERRDEMVREIELLRRFFEDTPKRGSWCSIAWTRGNGCSPKRKLAKPRRPKWHASARNCAAATGPSQFTCASRYDAWQPTSPDCGRSPRPPNRQLAELLRPFRVGGTHASYTAFPGLLLLLGADTGDMYGCRA